MKVNIYNKTRMNVDTEKRWELVRIVRVFVDWSVAMVKGPPAEIGRKGHEPTNGKCEENATYNCTVEFHMAAKTWEIEFLWISRKMERNEQRLTWEHSTWRVQIEDALELFLDHLQEEMECCQVWVHMCRRQVFLQNIRAITFAPIPFTNLIRFHLRNWFCWGCQWFQTR